MALRDSTSVLSQERRNEIAYLFLRQKVGKEGIKLGGFKRDMGNASKVLGVSEEELKAFMREFLLSFVD